MLGSRLWMGLCALLWVASAGANAVKPPDWVFSKTDYKKMLAEGKHLSFSSDSAWLPERYRAAILATIHFAFTSNRQPEISREISSRDFFHGHITCPINKIDHRLALEIQLAELMKTFERLKWEGLDEKSEYVEESNLASYQNAAMEMEKAAAEFLEWVRTAGVCESEVMLFHTLEQTKPDSMDYGDPTRNIIADVALPVDPRAYVSENAGSAGGFRRDFLEYFQVNFLVDIYGEIHASVWNRSTMVRFWKQSGREH